MIISLIVLSTVLSTSKILIFFVTAVFNEVDGLQSTPGIVSNGQKSLELATSCEDTRSTFVNVEPKYGSETVLSSKVDAGHVASVSTGEPLVTCEDDGEYSCDVASGKDKIESNHAGVNVYIGQLWPCICYLFTLEQLISY